MLLGVALVLIMLVLIPVLYGISGRTLTRPVFFRELIELLFYAIITPIVSEFIFRGVLQNIVHSLTKNIHAAVFITSFVGSILASIISLFALITLLLLNVTLGYLYWRTRHLMWPMLISSLITALCTILSFLSLVSPR